MTYPWHTEQLKQWQVLVESQRLPHAVMLSGAKGLGYLDFAKKMAHIALCENLGSDGVCHQCKGCHLIAVGNHTDLSLIQAEKSVIKVDQIRTLTKNVVLSSTRGQYRVIIIENIEQMNNASANALLKTLEEPPGKVVLILTTHEIGRILPTIKSRCVKMNLIVPAIEDVSVWLKEKTKANQQDIDYTLVLANNAPLIALSILLNDEIVQIDEMLNDLQVLQSNQSNASVLEISKKWHDQQWYLHFPHIANFFLTMLKHQHRIGLMDNGNIFESKIMTFKQGQDSDEIFRFLTELHQFSRREKTAIKTELLIEELLIKWKSVGCLI